MNSCDHQAGAFKVYWVRGRMYIVCLSCGKETRAQVDEAKLEAMN